MTNAEKCIAWFNANGIHAWSPTQDEFILIMVNDMEINISTAEVEYRCELYNEQFNEQ
jgi:hypothetical protein